MSISMYQSSVKRLQDEVADLRKKLGELSKKKADVIGDISRTQDSMARTKSLSTLKSKQRDLERLYDKLGNIEKQQSDLEKKLATKSKDLSDNQIKLNKALEDEEKKRARERKSQLDKELRQAQAINRELEKATSGSWPTPVIPSWEPILVSTPLLSPPSPEVTLMDKLHLAFPNKRPSTLETFKKIIEEYEKYECGEKYDSQEKIAHFIPLALSTFNNYLKQLRDANLLPQ